MGFTKGTIKYILHVFNLLIVISSLALIVIGAIYLVDLNNLTSELDGNARISYFFVIAVGVLVFAIAFIGCWGTIKENKCFLLLYACILVMVLIIQVTIGVYASLEIRNNDVLKSKIRRTVDNSVKNYHKEENSKNYMDYLQMNLVCCGVDSSYDYRIEIPLSCCKESKCTEDNSYSDGCARKLFEYIKDSGKEIGYVVLGLSLIEFVPSLLALWLRGLII